MSTTANISYDQYSLIVNSGAFEERRLELIHGEIREMSPIGLPHEEAVDYLAAWSFENLDRSKTRVRIQHSIGLPRLDSVPEPDIAWVTQKSYLNERPLGKDVLLVVEVADSSLRYDLNEKASLYAAAGVPDYWVVDLKHQRVEVFREPTIEGYGIRETFKVDSIVRPLQFPKVELNTKLLFGA